VTVVRPGGRNAYGDDVGAVTQFDIEGCLFAPGPSREPGFADLQVQTDGTVYAPAGPPATDVRPTDRMLVRGLLYSVVGEPQNWGSSGVVVALHRQTG
jgi:hypothetical protein